MALGDRAWHFETIWRAAHDLPVQEVPIGAIREIDEDGWFGGQPVTVRAVVDHAQRMDADVAAMP